MTMIREQEVTRVADPQLNAILLTVGVSFIVGPVIFSGAGAGPGLAFLLGGCLGLVIFSSWSGQVSGTRLLAAAVITFGLALLGHPAQTAVVDIGIGFGAVVAFAAAGTWAPRALLPRLALAAVVGGSLLGLSARAFIA
jgi:hypothetical protein